MELSTLLTSFETSIEALQAALQAVTREVDVSNSSQTTSPSPPESQLAIEQISQHSAKLPAQFQKIIAALSHAPLSPEIEQQMGMYQTEAHRRLRLIGIEAMRLRTARQPESISRGQQQLSGHVAQLQQFVQAMRTAVCGPG